MPRLPVIIISSVLSLVFGLSVNRAEAATLSFGPIASETTVGSTMAIDVVLDSQGEVINAVEGVVTYDSDMLDLLSVTRGGSFISLWAEEPTEIKAGEIQFAGGIPDGTLTVGGKIIGLAFRIVSAGETTIAVHPERSGVYLHDGFGTPASLQTASVSFSAEYPSPFIPQLSSPSHPQEDQWYADNTFLVTWPVQNDTVVSYLLSRDSVAEPDDRIEENLGYTSYPSLTDGVWYFTFRQRLSGEAWGPIARLPIHVDSTPPEPFSVAVESDPYSGATLASFSAIDRTSGVAGYIVRVERSQWWKPWATSVEQARSNGVFEVRDDHSVQRITVMAVDEAGNAAIAAWHSPRFRDGTNLLILLSITLLLILSAVLYILVHRSPRRRR